MPAVAMTGLALFAVALGLLVCAFAFDLALAWVAFAFGIAGWSCAKVGQRIVERDPDAWR